ncbi:hypothetical protein ABZ502_17380 [Streptomyces abikoensis]|uniref:hypothetical protein n=1 Tax=Streptomyces abikoensis TaxID=97398 RepID=UPI0033C3F1C9
MHDHDTLMDDDGHPVGLSPEESRLAADYLAFLDLVSRSARALERGQWTHLQEKAEDLARAAETLAVSAARAGSAATPARTGSVIASITAKGWEHPVVQHLHPGPYGAARPAGGAR